MNCCARKLAPLPLYKATIIAWTVMDLVTILNGLMAAVMIAILIGIANLLMLLRKCQ